MTTTAVSTTTLQPPTTAAPPPTAPPVTMGNGQPPPAGYPKLVDVSSLDYRVANQFQRSGTTHAVALAPGVYAAYNPNVPDLASYYEGPSYGDCAARNSWFPESGGACWSGVR